MELLILLIVIIIIGALLGGKSFGGTIRKGCGFLILVIIVLAIFFFLKTDSSKENNEVISTGDNSAYFLVKENCPTYIEPNLESDTYGNLEIGEEFFVKDPNKLKNYYELIYTDGKKAFVKKECLIRK